MQQSNQWIINQHASDEEAYRILTQDLIWNCFALADLEPPYRSYAQYVIAQHALNHDNAICLLLRHPIIGQVVSPFGSVEGVKAILTNSELPDHPLIQSQKSHFSTLQHFYQPATEWKTLLRMSLDPEVWRVIAPSLMSTSRARQLTYTDLPALEHCYQQNPEGTFSPTMFAHNIYVGMYEGKDIVAAGGTHILAPNSHIAVLGNIFTMLEARRKGYATAITATLVAILLARNYSTIVLNVFDDNDLAIRVYQRLGFRNRHALTTGRAILSK